MLDEVEVESNTFENSTDESAIKIEKVTASWTEDATTETLKEVNVVVANKNLCTVVGIVGAGKVLVTPPFFQIQFFRTSY